MKYWLFVLPAVLSVIGFVVVYRDKRKARLHKWRTPEKTFLLLSLFGGGAGVLLGFFLCHHKTKHLGLMAGVALLAVLSYGLFAFLYLHI